MTDTARDFIAALGRLLLEIAGEQYTAPAPSPAAEPQPAPQPEAPKKNRQGQRPERDYTCIVCGSPFRSSGNHPLLCPHCRILRTNCDKNFLPKFAAAKARLAKRDDPSQDDTAPLPDGKLRCERMHATIPATMCGTREECHGCKQRSAFGGCDADSE